MDVYRYCRFTTFTIITLALIEQFSLDFTMAVVGWLMFGDNVRDEVTSNIFLSNDYPEAISIAMITLIAVIPITKVPLR